MIHDLTLLVPVSCHRSDDTTFSVSRVARLNLTRDADGRPIMVFWTGGETHGMHADEAALRQLHQAIGIFLESGPNSDGQPPQR